MVAAGLIGVGVSVAHGAILHRMVSATRLASAGFAPALQRLIPLLLQFSTLCWLGGGVALIASPTFAPDARLATALLVGSWYAFGALGNLWGTRGRHPGWVLLAAAVALIAYAIAG